MVEAEDGETVYNDKLSFFGVDPKLRLKKTDNDVVKIDFVHRIQTVNRMLV